MSILYEKFKECAGVATDTRKDLRDTLFFCLKGETFDGNEFAVAEGQTVRIPRGSFHTIRAETLLKVMEIQTGEDIDVDDKIVWKSQE